MARATRFVVRSSNKLTPYDFIVLMTVGQLGLRHPSLAAMVQAIGAKLSREGLHERFTARAVLFMQQCLNRALHHKISLPHPLQVRILKPFRRVLIFDSSNWDIKPKLHDLFPGAGGNASSANCKLQLGYEYKRGQIDFFYITPGNRPDQAHSAELPGTAQAGDLILHDLGYFSVDTFRQYVEKKAFFLSRLLTGTTLRCQENEELIDLPVFLQSTRKDVFELQVVLANVHKQRAPCRLICLRASVQQANERRRKLYQKSKDQGRIPTQTALAFCDWMLLITNVPKSLLPIDQAHALYRVRWQVELLFKQFKSILRVHQSNTACGSRLLCELLGKLLMAVIVHRMHAEIQAPIWAGQRREVSFDKLYKRIQERSFVLLKRFLISVHKAVCYLRMEIPCLIKSCLKNVQPSRRSTLQRLDQLHQPNDFTALA